MYEVKSYHKSIFSINFLYGPGQYEVHISVGHTATDLSTRCKAFELPSDLKRHQTSIECDRAMRGDKFIVKKMDTGSLRLFEMYLISKR